MFKPVSPLLVNAQPVNTPHICFQGVWDCPGSTAWLNWLSHLHPLTLTTSNKQRTSCTYLRLAFFKKWQFSLGTGGREGRGGFEQWALWSDQTHIRGVGVSGTKGWLGSRWAVQRQDVLQSRAKGRGPGSGWEIQKRKMGGH